MKEFNYKAVLAVLDDMHMFPGDSDEIDEFEEIYPIEEFEQALIYNAFTPEDGSGVYIINGEKTEVGCFDPKPEGATHVVWYNK